MTLRGVPRHTRGKVLLIDRVPSTELAAELRHAGWVTVVSRSSEAGLAAIADDDFDAAILNRLIAGSSGIDLCRALRARSEDLPIMFVAAPGGVEERLAAFVAGADDYVEQPADPREVVFRLRAITRRSSRTVARTDCLPGPQHVCLRRRGRIVTVGRTPIELTSKEFAVLQLLLTRRGEVLAADELALAVWGYETYGARNFIEAHVSRLRSKLAVAGASEVVSTVRSIGYVVR